jgi:hypothetical protein
LANLEDEYPEDQNYAAQHPEVVERLTQLYEKWMKEVSMKNDKNQ